MKRQSGKECPQSACLNSLVEYKGVLTRKCHGQGETVGRRWLDGEDPEQAEGDSWIVTGALMVGSSVVSGSDPEMEGELADEDSGGNEWKLIESWKRKKNWGQISETESEKGNHQTRRRKEEYKVLLKFATESVNVINPLKLTKALKEKLGTVESIKTLRDEKLILFCTDDRQQKMALGLKSLLGHKVVCSIPEEKTWVRGVITGIPTDVSAEKIIRNISGAAVKDVRRLIALEIMKRLTDSQ